MQVAEATLQLAAAHGTQPHTGLSEYLACILDSKSFSQLSKAQQAIAARCLPPLAAASPAPLALLQTFLTRASQQGMVSFPCILQRNTSISWEYPLLLWHHWWHNIHCVCSLFQKSQVQHCSTLLFNSSKLSQQNSFCCGEFSLQLVTRVTRSLQCLQSWRAAWLKYKSCVEISSCALH